MKSNQIKENKQGIGRLFYNMALFSIISLFLFNIFLILLIDYYSYDSVSKNFFLDSNLKRLTGRPVIGTSTVSIGIIRNCTETFGSGYTLFSIYKNLTNKSIAYVFPYDYNKINVILEWNESLQTFSAFSPLSPNNPYNTFDEDKSYMILFSNSSNCAFYYGTQFGDFNISLAQSVNAVTYPYNFTANITKYTSQFGSNLKYVLKWNRSSQKFAVYSPLAAEPEFATINKGEGQFIVLSTAQHLYYNRSALT